MRAIELRGGESWAVVAGDGQPRDLRPTEGEARSVADDYTDRTVRRVRWEFVTNECDMAHDKRCTGCSHLTPLRDGTRHGIIGHCNTVNGWAIRRRTFDGVDCPDWTARPPGLVMPQRRECGCVVKGGTRIPCDLHVHLGGKHDSGGIVRRLVLRAVTAGMFAASDDGVTSSIVADQICREWEILDKNDKEEKR